MRLIRFDSRERTILTTSTKPVKPEHHAVQGLDHPSTRHYELRIWNATTQGLSASTRFRVR